MKAEIKKFCPRCGKPMKVMGKNMTTGDCLWECPHCKVKGWDGQLK